jgi:hypothetical protein
VKCVYDKDKKDKNLNFEESMTRFAKLQGRYKLAGAKPDTGNYKAINRRYL